MKKILLLMLGCVALVSCGPSKGKFSELAKENLELSLDNPKQLKVIAVSQPDSAFGTGYFSQDEVKSMIKVMQLVTDTIMKRTDGMRSFNPDDAYVLNLADRQMKAMSEIRSLVGKAGRKGEFSGWKVRIDYSCVDANGNPYHAERWCFIDKDGRQVYKTFELPLP